MINYKKAYTEFIYSTNFEGSNKAASYVKALEWLSKILEVKPLSFGDCKNIWSVNSVERLHELYLFVLQEARKKEASIWNLPNIPISYLKNGYCSAALKTYQEFLVGFSYEQKLLDALDTKAKDETSIIENINTDFQYPAYLIDDLDKKQGEDVIRSVKVRSNQNVFRKKILEIYNQSCCITGLNIPEVNRASHIIPWAEDDKKRLDPSNGLCLSATYDAAFDRNLISLDDDYRIIISKDITDQYTNESVKDYFISKEGEKIKLPSSYLPHKDCLADHRSKGNF